MYIPINNKSNYSLLSSLLKIDDLITYAKDNKLPSLALADTYMYGTMEFINKCNANNIKPIIGLSLKLNDFTITLYAKNYLGYKSLIKLSTIQNERVVEKEDLIAFNKEVIAVITDISKYKILTDIYSHLYIGYTNKKEEADALLYTKNIVFFRENLCLTETDSTYLSYLYDIRDGKTITDETNYILSNHSLNIPDLDMLTSNAGLVNLENICHSCLIEFPPVENLLPIYECSDAPKFLFELTKAGLTKRLGGTIPKKYQERLSYELKVITDMGFPNYFLVVYDFIKYAKKNNILVGPGRGSAAGSLVAYSLGITDIDPLQYDLLFERFLNPERKTMPDIDTDFPDNKRDDVINYVINKYGKRRVCGIVTFGRMSAKMVIRDVSRVLNIPLYKVDNLTKYIPNISHDKLQDIYTKNAGFKATIDSDTNLTKMYNIALKLEDFPRHTSSHAAGIVMSKIDLDEVIPLTMSEGMYLTSYSMEYLEPLGLLKMDFLGLKNLTIIANILNDIKTSTGGLLDFTKIPMNDEEALNIFTTANTEGIFQFESTGMKQFLKRLRPTTFEDIFAAIALFRPGPAINIDSYIKRKHGEEKVTYLDPSLEPILKNTYGIFIYQEQIMQVANIFAGYSLGEADILRRAMSKKKYDLLKSEEDKFIKKSMAKGHSEALAKEIFALVLNFAGYGFNRSHSVAYSIIAYKMAYLKAHYPAIFFANLLTNAIDSASKTHEYIMEARANHIEITKPNINLSTNRYFVKDNKIIYPFSNIKGVGLVVSNAILLARSSGIFTDIYDAFSRLYISGVGKKAFEQLIFADCFANFCFTRATLIYNLDALFNYAELTKDLDPSLVAKPDLEEQVEYDNNYLLEKEKEVYGFYLSKHPTTIYLKDNKEAIPLNEVTKYFNKEITTLILVDKVKVINTKKGDKMSFITGSDETGSMEYTLFPKTYDLYPNIVKGDLLKVLGNVEKRLNEYQIVIRKIKNLKESDTNEKERENI